MKKKEKKYKNYKLRKILRIFIMIFSVITIVLAILSLTIHLNVFYAIMAFVLTTVFTKYRNSLEFDNNKIVKRNK